MPEFKLSKSKFHGAEKCKTSSPIWISSDGDDDDLKCKDAGTDTVSKF